MGAVATSLLMTSVFLPIGLSAYDMLLLPVANMVQQRRESGEPMGKALLGTLLIALTLPITIVMALLGISFKGADAAMAIAERETTRVGERVLEAEGEDLPPPPGLHDHLSVTNAAEPVGGQPVVGQPVVEAMKALDA